MEEKSHEFLGGLGGGFVGIREQKENLGQREKFYTNATSIEWVFGSKTMQRFDWDYLSFC